jgi:hypothetical protein
MCPSVASTAKEDLEAVIQLFYNREGNPNGNIELYHTFICLYYQHRAYCGPCSST